MELFVVGQRYLKCLYSLYNGYTYIFFPLNYDITMYYNPVVIIRLFTVGLMICILYKLINIIIVFTKYNI